MPNLYSTVESQDPVIESTWTFESSQPIRETLERLADELGTRVPRARRTGPVEIDNGDDYDFPSVARRLTTHGTVLRGTIDVTVEHGYTGGPKVVMTANFNSRRLPRGAGLDAVQQFARKVAVQLEQALGQGRTGVA